MSEPGMNRITENSGETHLRVFLQVTSIPAFPMRVWIFSMTLVLIGLARLEIR